MKIVSVIIIGLMLGACSSTIKTVNTGRAIQGLSKAGVTESATNCIMDIFDPGNRGSGC
jgi:predicted MFS family arabinose efflux permease